MSETEKKYSRTRLTEALAIKNLLDQVLLKQEGGTYTYPPGWNDRRVGDAVKMKDTVVKRVRQELYGRIRKTYTKGGKKVADVSGIERRLAEVEARLHALETKGRLI